MTDIQSQPILAGISPGQNALSNSQFSSYVTKQSYNAYESLNAGLTIKTKEGDIVTLTSSTYAKLDAFMYNSKGVLQTDTGKAVVTQNQREITLASGESFTFSVVGDLSKEELGDIDAIVKGIDEIISQMANGNMDDAVATALSMGGFDKVSSYTADINYEKSYAMVSEVQANTVNNIPGEEVQAKSQNNISENEILPKEKNLFSSEIKPFPENHRPKKAGSNFIEKLAQFVEKMVEQLDKHDEKLVDKARNPIDKLFKHHLKNMRENNGEEKSTYDAFENVRNQIDKLIDKIAVKTDFSV